MTAPPSAPPSARPSAPSEHRASRRPRPDRGRVLLVSLAASVLFHGLALLLYMVFVGPIRGPAEPAAPPGRAMEPEGVEILRITEVPEPSFDDPAEPEEPEPAEPEPEPGTEEPGAETGAEEEAEAPVPSVAERLRPPESGDPRLWRPVDPGLTELTPEQRARIRIYGLFRELSDSLLTEEERARAARDWTYTDDEGRRWGLADGKIYLGETEIPFPFAFSRPPTVEDGQLQWQWDDARRGARDGLVWDSWEERSEAIRRRRDAERADSTDSGGS